MSRRTWKQWFGQLTRRTRTAKPRSMQRSAVTFEQLGVRLTPAVNAFFSAGVLTVNGDNNNNTIEVSRDAAGKLLVNGGAINVRGGTPTVANTKSIQVFAQGGNDSVT